ncbi:EFR1 family ferrodoxin [Bacteroidota bacterium]
MKTKPAYKKLLVYYLSGTGNARNAAHWLAEDFTVAGVKAEVYTIDRYKNMPDPGLGEDVLLGFCFPTHGFNPAPYMLKFIWKFPRAKMKTHVFLLNTRAGMKLSKLFLPGLSGLAQILPTFILLVKGYKVVYMQPLDLPSNWISIHPGIKPRVVESIHQRCRGIISRMSQRLLAGKRRYQAFWSLPLDLAVLPISVLYYFLGRYGLAKTFYSTSDCNQCSICIDNCPIKAITYKRGHPYWSYRCESCMRCMNLCPQRSIQASHGYTIPLWWAISAFLYPIMYAELNKYTDFFVQTGILSKFGNIIIQGIAFLLVSISAYFVAHYLMKLKPIERLFRFSSLTYYKFWRRYKAPGLKVINFIKDRI